MTASHGKCHIATTFHFIANRFTSTKKHLENTLFSIEKYDSLYHEATFSSLAICASSVFVKVTMTRCNPPSLHNFIFFNHFFLATLNLNIYFCHVTTFFTWESQLLYIEGGTGVSVNLIEIVNNN